MEESKIYKAQNNTIQLNDTIEKTKKLNYKLSHQLPIKRKFQSESIIIAINNSGRALQRANQCPKHLSHFHQLTA
jgi:hypothetical protein